MSSFSTASLRLKVAAALCIVWLASVRMLGLRGAVLGGVMLAFVVWWALAEERPEPQESSGTRQFSIGTIQHDRLVVELDAPDSIGLPAVALALITVALFFLFPLAALGVGLTGVGVWMWRDTHPSRVIWLDSAQLALPGEWTLPLKGITQIRVDAQVVSFKDSSGQTRRIRFRGPVHPTAAARFRAVLCEAVDRAEVVTSVEEPESLRALRGRALE